MSHFIALSLGTALLATLLGSCGLVGVLSDGDAIVNVPLAVGDWDTFF